MLTADEQETLTAMALAMMNAEELLGALFSGFYTKKQADQKKYLFVGWLFWAYLRVKMEEILANGMDAPYGYLEELPANDHVITLNYTMNFFPEWN